MNKFLAVLLSLVCMYSSDIQAASSVEMERNGIKLAIRPMFNDLSFFGGEKVLPAQEVTANHLKAQGYYAFKVGIQNTGSKTIVLDKNSFKGIDIISNYDDLASKCLDTKGEAASIISTLTTVGGVISAYGGVIAYKPKDRRIFRSIAIPLLAVGIGTGFFAYFKGHDGFAQAFQESTVSSPCIIPPKSQITKIIYLDRANFSLPHFYVLLRDHTNLSKIAAKFEIDW